ncbi:5-(carboxyamino)imidazole ribonucleotide synthase [Shimazuella sp. AN120528]|uniref:5-(carboxyamino)imidazole ribonucleotide synthase n=1 Tax=Shimazuella soli TaxID=1892854 RepID=UPI001F0FBFED|nr:5-(carboxyamino)imidazole ribonucleotide synthase [Shimazuella soli]MCH5586610.1 5-(carboxyamino)imidazole ribonucleotide synthase [Shimazuella soli]
MSILLPNQTIGVLGGGQLGRMIILEGRKMGYRFATLDPSEDAPGVQVSDYHVKAGFDDLDSVDKLASLSDLIIYEFENIDPTLVQRLEQQTSVPQGSKLLEVTRHRLMEKAAIEEAGVPVAPYAKVTSTDELLSAIDKIGLPAVLKTVTGGYDGKGQWTFHTKQDVSAWLAENDVSARTFILEKFIPFLKEISVVVARSVTGGVKAFPPAVNLHRNHILHLSIAPATIAEETSQLAVELAKQVAEHLQVVGLLAVEMFLHVDGHLYINELAPRPHNSGHYTYDACNPSQFEQMLRAVIGLPLIEPTRYHSAIMMNVLGEHKEAFFRSYDKLPSNIKAHWYGKLEAKTGRKMGHVTVLTDDIKQGLDQLDQLKICPALTETEEKAIWTQ